MDRRALSVRRKINQAFARRCIRSRCVAQPQRTGSTPAVARLSEAAHQCPRCDLFILRRTLTVLALVALLLFPGVSEAKNMQGKLGFGYQSALTGARGLTLTYWAAERFALQFLAGAEFKLNKKNDVNTTIHFGLGGRFVVMSTRSANLSIG